MQNHPLISVLMTAYNREKYIAEAIESVMASTYQNWELIIVDDQSKDKTVEIAKSYEAKDKRIKVYINEENLGDYPNRNKAASYAKGKYLKYVDADDLIYPYGLEQLVFYMEQFPQAAYGLCSLPQDNDRIYPFELSPGEAYYRHYFTNKWIFHKAPLSAIIKKDIFDKAGGFTGKRMVGDFEMWQILSQKHKVVLMPGGIVWYREHEEGEMQFARENTYQMFEYLLTEKELLASSNCPLSKNEQQIAIKKAERKQARYILRYLKSHGLKTALALQKKS
ncbi:MAG TPA: glycosyltransferase family 2 protein, partial [Oceanospirillales bacterium]|nr:glycosyltransferase family 2 protein [Oceanospirillales bacterium]